MTPAPVATEPLTSVLILSPGPFDPDDGVLPEIVVDDELISDDDVTSSDVA